MQDLEHQQAPHPSGKANCFAGGSRRTLLKTGLPLLAAASVRGVAAAFPQQTPTAPSATYVPGTAKRLSQLTGDADPAGLPHPNHTARWGISGTDMGCPVEFRGKLFLLFGDVPTTVPVDLDPVCYTTDKRLQHDNLRIRCVTGSAGQFRPLTVDGRTMGTNETVTGAFAYGDRLYAFVVRGNSKPYSTLVSNADPLKNTDFASLCDISDVHGKFWQIAPCVIRNADWPGLPSAQGDGLLLWGQSGASVYLAWMPLPVQANPKARLRYYAANGVWTEDQTSAAPVFNTEGVTQISVTWLPEPGKWICLYTTASVPAPSGSIVVRVATTPWSWSEEIPIFDPSREDAWGKYMHRIGKDALDHVAPPRDPTLPGYAYSPFLLSRYTTWSAVSRQLRLTYLMATFVPYQVMLMQATLRLA